MGTTGGSGGGKIYGDLAALDVLFVIDDSGSMDEEIASLKANIG